jgi:hypothetical protein
MVSIITDFRRRKERYYYSVSGLNTADISASSTNVYLRVYNTTVTLTFLTVVTMKTAVIWQAIYNTRAQ